MSKDIKEKLKVIDSSISSYDERSGHIDKILGELEGENVLSLASSNDKIAQMLESQATFLLNSSDIDSGRKVEYGYYRDERDYRSNYSIGKNTVATEEVKIASLSEKANVDFPKVNIEHIDFRKVDISKRRNFLIDELCEINNPVNSLSSIIKVIHDNLINEINNKDDAKIVESLSSGLTVDEIASDFNISRRSVVRRIEKLCEKHLNKVITV